MKNVFKLKLTGPFLRANNFKRVNFRFNGKLNSVGACLYNETGSDCICIEPKYDGYMLSGSGIVYHGRQHIGYCTGRELKNRLIEYMKQNNLLILGEK